MKKVLLLLMCVFIGLVSNSACCIEETEYINSYYGYDSDIGLSEDNDLILDAKDSYDLSEIKEAFQSVSEQPTDMSTYLIRDLDEVIKRLGNKEPIYLSDEVAYCAYKCDNGGTMYVVFWDDLDEYDYYPVELVTFTMRDLCFDDFDSIQIGASTIDDVENIDPAVKVTYIDYGEEKYTTHFTRDGVVKFNYIVIGEKVVVDSIEIMHHSLVKHLLEFID